MKRILMVLPVIMVMILGCIPFTASAAYDENKYLEQQFFTDFIQKQGGSGAASYYCYIKFHEVWSNDGYSGNRNWSCYFEFDSENDFNCSSNDTAGLVNLVVSSRTYANLYLSSVIFWDNSDTSVSSSQPDRYDSFGAMSYDRNTNEIIFYSKSGDILFTISSSQFTSIDTNCFEVQRSLDVRVSFTPALSGNVDRTVTGSDGSSGLSQSFRMDISNYSYTNIQYRMVIVKGEASEIGYYDNNYSNIIYQYLTSDWVYGIDIKDFGVSDLNFQGNNVKQNKPTNWHYLGQSDSFSQVFKWSQINFEANTTYSVIVSAFPTDDGFATSSIMGANNLYRHWVNLDDYETVYSSTFSIDYLGDVTYNPNDTSNGIIANSTQEDFNRAMNTRNAIENEDGSIDYSSYNAYDDPDSQLNKMKDFNERIQNGDYNYFTDDDYSNGNYFRYVPSDVSSFGSGFSNFGSFLYTFMSYFPAAIWQIFIFGLMAIVVIAIIKAVK